MACHWSNMGDTRYIHIYSILLHCVPETWRFFLPTSGSITDFCAFNQSQLRKWRRMESGRKNVSRCPAWKSSKSLRLEKLKSEFTKKNATSRASWDRRPRRNLTKFAVFWHGFNRFWCRRFSVRRVRRDLRITLEGELIRCLWKRVEKILYSPYD